MSKFGDRFNEWLVERGEEPVPAGTVQQLNEVAEKVVAYFREHQGGVVAGAQQLIADCLAGEPEERDESAGD